MTLWHAGALLTALSLSPSVAAVGCGSTSGNEVDASSAVDSSSTLEGGRGTGDARTGTDGERGGDGETDGGSQFTDASKSSEGGSTLLDAGPCGPPNFQCSGSCMCSGAYVIDHSFVASVSPATMCDLKKQGWTNGANIPPAACESACGDASARSCEPSDAYYAAFNAANAGSAPDAGLVCPPTPDGSATVELTCEVQRYDPDGGCQWTMCTP